MGLFHVETDLYKTEWWSRPVIKPTMEVSWDINSVKQDGIMG